MKVKHINLNYSTAKEWYECRRKFAFSKALRLEPIPLPTWDGQPVDDTKQAWFKGVLIHAGLEAYEQGLDWYKEMDKMVPLMSIMKSLGDDKSGSFKHMTEVVRLYIEHYKNPEDMYEVIQTEQRLEIPINSWLTINGTLDVVARNRKTGRLILLDYKSSSSFNMFTIPMVHLNPQFALYQGLAQRNGLPIESTVVDCISSAHKDLKDYEKKPSGLFQRVDTNRTEGQVNEVIDTMIQVGEEMRTAIETGIYPPTMNPGICKAYNKKCEFFDVCQEPLEVRTSMLENNYKKASDTGNFMLTLEQEDEGEK